MRVRLSLVFLAPMLVCQDASSVRRLGFGGWVPPGIEEVNMVGCGQVESSTARLKAQQHQLYIGFLLKVLDDFSPVFGTTIEPGPGRPGLGFEAILNFVE